MSSDETTLRWDGGGEGRVVSLEGEVVVVRSTRAHAPGSRPTGVLSTGAPIRMKAHRSRRDETPGDGMTFTVDGRMLDLTRDLRATLEAALTPKPSV